MGQCLRALDRKNLVEPIVMVLDPQMSLKEMERHIILQTFKRQNYNRTRTAKTLGIGLRTLQRKLKKYKEPDGRHDAHCFTAHAQQPQYII